MLLLYPQNDPAAIAALGQMQPDTDSLKLRSCSFGNMPSKCLRFVCVGSEYIYNVHVRQVLYFVVAIGFQKICHCSGAQTTIAKLFTKQNPIIKKEKLSN